LQEDILQLIFTYGGDIVVRTPRDTLNARGELMAIVGEVDQRWIWQWSSGFRTGIFKLEDLALVD